MIHVNVLICRMSYYKSLLYLDLLNPRTRRKRRKENAQFLQIIQMNPVLVLRSQMILAVRTKRKRRRRRKERLVVMNADVAG